MNEEAELQRFAELLMRLVRDKSIAACDTRAAGRIGGPTGQRWKAQITDERTREAVRALIPEIVDAVLFRLLNALDQGDLPLAWQAEDGSFADLYTLGTSEMAGWFMAGDGWRAQYSSQRFANPDDA
jgi:hypothetical protein